MGVVRGLAVVLCLLAGCTAAPVEVSPTDSAATDPPPEATGGTATIGTTATPTPQPTSEPTPEVTLALGTRTSPLPLGTEFTIDDWRLKVLSVVLDAWDVIEAENQFNDPPAEGRQYVMFRVAGTYEGEDSGTAWLDLSWAIVGAAGNTFGTSMDDSCGVIPDPLSDEGETFTGGMVEGNECVSVESAQLDGAAIRVQGSFLSDDRVFVALD